MEIILAISIVGNFISWLILFRLFSKVLDTPEKKAERQRLVMEKMTSPSTIMPQDSVDLSEIPEDEFKEAIKKHITTESKDDETPDIYNSI
jgi:hypothetical protein